MRWIYQPLYFALLVVAAPFLLLSRGAHYVPTLKRRFLGPSGHSAGEKSLWMHAVSVGETGVAAVLARRLPGHGRLTLTTVTPTGQHAAATAIGERVDLTYLPFDLFWAVRRFLDWARPTAAVLVEGDYWPFLLSALKRRRVPVYVVNGRVSDRSFRRLRLLPRFVTRAYLSGVDRFGVQSAQDRERLLTLGIDPAKVKITGNLKFDVRATEAEPELEHCLRQLAGDRAILVAGSSMQGEEEQILEAFGGLADRAMLLLAPRHPERAPAVRELADERGFRVVMRSEIDVGAGLGPPGEGGRDRTREGRKAPPLRSTTYDLRSTTYAAPDVVVLDTIGELAGLYRLAASAFIGGTLVPTGGHNPLEPAAHAIPVLAGPSTENFRTIADQFDRERAWRRVADSAELKEVWDAWLDDPERAADFGRRAKRLLEANRGAVDATLEFLQPLIDRWQNAVGDD